MIRSPGENVGKDLLMVANLFPKRIGKIGRDGRDETMYAALDLDACQAIGISNGEASQANSIHELKNSGVNADSESQCKDRGDGKAGALAQ